MPPVLPVPVVPPVPGLPVVPPVPGLPLVPPVAVPVPGGIMVPGGGRLQPGSGIGWPTHTSQGPQGFEQEVCGVHLGQAFSSPKLEALHVGTSSTFRASPFTMTPQQPKQSQPLG